MKVSRLGLCAPASRMARWRPVTDFILLSAAPILLLLGAVFVANQVGTAQKVVGDISAARRIEQRALDTFLYVHTVKSRRLEYLLTGSEHYLAHAAPDQARVARNFDQLRRQVAGDPVLTAQLIQFHAKSQKLLDITAKAVAARRAGRDGEAAAIFTSPEFAKTMDDTGIGGRIIVFAQRDRIAALQLQRAASFHRALFGAVILLLALGAYCALRIAIMSSSMRRQKLTLLTLERARQAAEDARNAAEEASRTKSHFLASVSHELRTPLNAILGFSDMIRCQALGPVGNRRYHEYGCDIHKSGRHLLTLVENILDLTKLGAGKMEIRESRFETETLIGDCMGLLGSEAHSHLTLVRDLPARLPHIRGDFTLIKQILLNLLSNAAKFTPRGGKVTVSARHRPGEGLAIAVSDTGIGMNEPDIEKAMAMFGQIDSHVARRHHGTGLGLPLSRSYAELHGGRLTVESEPGQGTCVTLLLPDARLFFPAQAIAG